MYCALHRIYLSSLIIVNVFHKFFQGLIFKDLATPYYLGEASRSRGYWWKLKPDYDESGSASDIDLLVLGGRFASGFDKRGMVSSLVVGCLDENHCFGSEDAKYMAVTKVKFGKNTAKGKLIHYSLSRKSAQSEHLTIAICVLNANQIEFSSRRKYRLSKSRRRRRIAARKVVRIRRDS